MEGNRGRESALRPCITSADSQLKGDPNLVVPTFGSLCSTESSVQTGTQPRHCVLGHWSVTTPPILCPTLATILSSLSRPPAHPPTCSHPPSQRPHPLPHVHSQWSLHVRALAPFSSLSPLPCLMFWQVLWVLTILPVPKLLSRPWMDSRLAWRGWRCSWRGQRMLIAPTEGLWEPLDTKH